jgi:hypothetical protein
VSVDITQLYRAALHLLRTGPPLPDEPLPTGVVLLDRVREGERHEGRDPSRRDARP